MIQIWTRHSRDIGATLVLQFGDISACMVHGLDMKEKVIISESMAQQTAWENFAKLSSSDEFKSNFYKFQERVTCVFNSLFVYTCLLSGMFQ